MTGLGEFIRKSRSAYEEIQTSKALSLKGCIIRDIFRKASDFCQNISYHFTPRETDDFTDIGDFAMFRCFIYIISVKYCIVMKEILSVICQY